MNLRRAIKPVDRLYHGTILLYPFIRQKQIYIPVSTFTVLHLLIHSEIAPYGLNCGFYPMTGTLS